MNIFEGIPQTLVQGAIAQSELKTRQAMEQARLRQASLESFKQGIMQKYLLEKQLDEQAKQRHQQLGLGIASMGTQLGGALGGAALQANALKGLFSSGTQQQVGYDPYFVGPPAS